MGELKFQPFEIRIGPEPGVKTFKVNPEARCYKSIKSMLGLYRGAGQEYEIEIRVREPIGSCCLNCLNYPRSRYSQPCQDCGREARPDNLYPKFESKRSRTITKEEYTDDKDSMIKELTARNRALEREVEGLRGEILEMGERN